MTKNELKDKVTDLESDKVALQENIDDQEEIIELLKEKTGDCSELEKQVADLQQTIADVEDEPEEAKVKLIWPGDMPDTAEPSAWGYALEVDEDGTIFAMVPESRVDMELNREVSPFVKEEEVAQEDLESEEND